MEQIPRYSYDLIDELDKLVETPKLPTTAVGWHILNQDTVRLAAFQSGQRAIVDMLIDFKNEIEREKASDGGNEPTTINPDNPLGPVLGPDGEEHQTVASTYVGARMAPALPGSEEDKQEE